MGPTRPHPKLFLDILSINVYIPSKYMINKKKTLITICGFSPGKGVNMRNGQVWVRKCMHGRRFANGHAPVFHSTLLPCLIFVRYATVCGAKQFAIFRRKNICQNFVENCILLCEEKWSHAFCSQLICLIPASDIRPCLKCHLRNTPIHPLEMCKTLAL